MALVKWSAIISEIRGKLNGTVFAKNRYSCYARNKVTPFNPQTPAQQNIRYNFAQLSKQWRELTQEERDAWNRAVDDFIITNIFGDKYKPSGMNLFIRINMNLFLIKRPMITMPPVPSPVDFIRLISYFIEASTNKIEFIIESHPSINHFPTVFVTRPLSPGITFAKSEFRMIEFAKENVFGHPDQYKLVLGFKYANKYGNLTEFLGQRFFIKITPIDFFTGLNGIPIEESYIIE